MKIKDIYVIKKDGTKQSFDGEKIVRAINASAKGSEKSFPRKMKKEPWSWF